MPSVRPDADWEVDLLPKAAPLFPESTMVLFLVFANHQPSALLFEPLLSRLHVVWSDVLPALYFDVNRKVTLGASIETGKQDGT